MSQPASSPLRRLALAAVALLALWRVAGDPIVTLPVLNAQEPALSLGLERLFVLPGEPVLTSITHAGDGSGHLFVTTQTGRIYVYDGNQVRSTPFLDLSAQVSSDVERGLLGLAFHPEFVANGFFYVDYTDLAGDIVVARYQATPGANQADPASALVLLRIPHPQSNHNGGHLAFGPDGYLYIAVGDGGGAGDPPNNAQDKQSLLGKILRIDVDPFSDPPYRIPSSNPFLGDPGARPELWAVGLRNPWKYSFDRLTGELFIADVGQDRYEEVDVEAPGSGGHNYGWRLMEGPLCFNPSSACDPGGLTAPTFGYLHSAPLGGCSITGGYRYRGGLFPEFDGIYFFTDLCNSGIRGARLDPSGWTISDLGPGPATPTTFGEDEAGEIYVGGFTGNVYRLVITAGPTITIGDASAPEGAGVVSVPVTLSAAHDLPVSVHYETRNFVARAGLDFEATAGRLDFAPGETLRYVYVRLLDNSRDEPDRQFKVVLHSPVRATLARAEAAVTIQDDDDPPVVSIGDCAVEEGDPGSAGLCIFPVTLSSASGFDVVVDCEPVDGTALRDVDYESFFTRAIIRAGATQSVCSMASIGDLLIEGDETFFVNLAPAPEGHVTIGDGQGQGLIVDDDPFPPPSLSIVRPRDEAITAGVPLFIEWTAADKVGFVEFSLLLSTDGGVTYHTLPECAGLGGAGRGCTWSSPGPITPLARLRVKARDGRGLTVADMTSFAIVEAPLGNGIDPRGECPDDPDPGRRRSCGSR